MKKLYRWDAISSSTKVFGVVGSPIMHSMSPAIHNAGFDAVGFDGIYLPMLVEPGWESFKAFMETFVPFEGLDLSGLSVTIPHKENALRYLKEKGAQVEELAEAIGAVNTIVIDRSGKEPTLRGFNTDYAAILDSITAKMGIERDELENYRVAVIGAGGTGRTAVAALAHYGATVVVYNRTRERADALAKEFDGKSGKVVSARLEKLCDSCCHIFINTTSVGMWPKANESPIGDRPPKFESETVVFDSIYNPIKTKFLEQAEAAGAKTIGGVEMFVRQASGQFEAWTSKKAPTEVMRKVIEARLAH
jgi:3-dehydroquinate dehydratase/shikimate dehydrogenase